MISVIHAGYQPLFYLSMPVVKRVIRGVITLKSSGRGMNLRHIIMCLNPWMVRRMPGTLVRDAIAARSYIASATMLPYPRVK